MDVMMVRQEMFEAEAAMINFSTVETVLDLSLVIAKNKNDRGAFANNSAIWQHKRGHLSGWIECKIRFRPVLAIGHINRDAVVDCAEFLQNKLDRQGA